MLHYVEGNGELHASAGLLLGESPLPPPLHISEPIEYEAGCVLENAGVEP